jgi:hypothetical protein
MFLFYDYVCYLTTRKTGMKMFDVSFHLICLKSLYESFRIDSNGELQLTQQEGLQSELKL